MGKKDTTQNNGKPKLRKLSVKQQKFVDAYTGECEGNATASYIKAGYKHNSQTASSLGCALLKKPSVAHAIYEATKETRGKAIATREDRQHLLTLIMLGDTASIPNAPGKQVVDKETGEVVVYPAPIPYKERLRAMEILARMQGDFIDVLISQTTQVLSVNQTLVADLQDMSLEELRAIRGLE